MTAVRFERVGDGVVRAGCPLSDVAFSPDGALLACRITRTDNPDFVVRERVYVLELPSLREVAALDGPQIVRGLGWVDPTRLLVVREARVGLSVALHEMPDGGVVATASLAEATQNDARVVASADGRRVAITTGPSWWASRVRVFELPALAPGPDLIAPGDFVLDGDGRRLATVDFDEGPVHLRALDDGSDEEVPLLGERWFEYLQLTDWPAPEVLRGVAYSEDASAPVTLQRGPDGFALLSAKAAGARVAEWAAPARERFMVWCESDPPRGDATLVLFDRHDPQGTVRHTLRGETRELLEGAATGDGEAVAFLLRRESETSVGRWSPRDGTFATWLDLPGAEPMECSLRGLPDCVAVMHHRAEGARLYLLSKAWDQALLGGLDL